MNEQEVRSRLEPYHQTLIDCVLGGWTRWMEDFAPRLPLRARRTRPAVMHDLMMEQAGARFEEVPGVTVLRLRSRGLVSFNGELLVRFKQLADDCQPRNYPTPTAIRFDAQKPLRLPGIPDACRVTIGYTPNEHGFEVSGIYVMMTGPRPWRYELLESHKGTVLSLPHTNTPPVTQKRAPGRRRVTVKSGEADHGDRAAPRKK